jgi:hypothetical protein
MKRVLYLSLGFFAVPGGVWLFLATRFTTSWETLEDRLPAAATTHGYSIVEVRLASADRVPLPCSVRILQAVMHPRTVPLVSGFPNSVRSYTLESVQNHTRLRCQVRYYEGMVARIVVEYIPNAKEEAIDLCGVLRKTFPNDVVKSQELTAYDLR